METGSPSRPQGGVTRRELRDVASGNITIEDIVNRARFDDTFQLSKFAVLIEDLTSPPLCCHYTWEAGVCLYGTRCRYVHNPDMVLRFLGDLPMTQRGPVVCLKRRPFECLMSRSETMHKVAFIEYQGRVVWYRDGGRKSADLWTKCQDQLQSRRCQLRAIASSATALDSVSNTSVPEYIELLELLLEDNFETLFSFLDIQDIVELFIAFVSNAFIREDLRTCLLSPLVWDSVIASKWELPFQDHEKAISSFLALKGATIEAHTQLVSSTQGLYTHGGGMGDPHPAQGRRALAELRPHATPGKTVLVSEEGNPVSSIRFTNSLIALSNGNEVSIFRTGDLVRVGTCKQKGACELVTIPSMHDSNLVVHAGQAGILFRDLDEPSLKINTKIPLQGTGELISLEAVAHSVFLGIKGKALQRISSETAQLVSETALPGLIASRMIRDAGRLHINVSQSDTLNSAIVSLYDYRMKGKSSLAELPSIPVCVGTNGYDSTIFAVGTMDACELLDIRKPSPLWSTRSVYPVRDISLSATTICLFQHSANQHGSVITTYSNADSSEPFLLGSHTLPFKVSAVGFQSGETNISKGSVFSIKRARRSGRGDNGILCIGGSAFVDRFKSVRQSRRESREVF